MKNIILFLVFLFLATSASWAQAPLRVGTNLWPGYEPIHLAKQLAYWDEGKQIRTIEYPAAIDVIRAFRNGALDVAALTLDEVFLLRQAGFKVKVILVLDTSYGGDVIVASPKYPNFKALKGKRVGVEAGALGAYVISRALEINGMTLEQIQPVPMPVNAHERAFKAGKVDAVVTFEPVRTKLLETGAVEVFTSRQMPGEIVDVLVSTDRVIKKNKSQINLLVSGWFKAISLLENEPAKASQIMAQRLKLSPSEVLKSYEGLKLGTLEMNRALLSGTAPELHKTIDKLNKALAQHKLIPPGLDMAGIVNDQFLPAN